MRVIGKIIGAVVSIPIILIAVSFAVSNFDAVSFRLYPFETELSLPLVLALFLVLLMGFALGAVAEYLRGGRLRRRVRNADYRLKSMEIESARLKREAEAAAKAAPPSLPAGTVPALRKDDAPMAAE